MAADPRAKFKITADGSDYKRKLKSALKDTNRFAGSVAQGLKRGAQAGAVALTAATVAITRMTSAANKNVDALAKQADILGITTQKLAAYQHAARLSGASGDSFEKGIRKLQKSIVDATNGLTTYTRAFDALQLDPAKLKAMTPDEQFEELAKAFVGVRTQAERVAIAYDLFGGRNTALLNTLVLTGSQLEKIEADTKAWGLALTRVDARQIEQANDAVERASSAMQGVATNIALAIAPLRGSLANAFADAAAESEGFKNEIQSTMEALVVAANFGANSIRGIALAYRLAQLAMLRIQETAARAFGDPRIDLEVQIKMLESKRETTRPEARGAIDQQLEGLRQRLGEADENSLDAILAREDAVGKAIDVLLGKFQTADEALAQLWKRQEDGLAAAQASVEQLAETPLLEQFLFGDEFEERMKAREEQILRMAERTANKLLKIEHRAAEERARLEQRLQAQVTQFRQAALQTGIALLQTFGGKSKGLAAAAIAIEKAAAVTSIILSTNRAAAAALAPPPLGMGPVAGQGLAASIKVAGYANAAMTAALGIGQIASLGSGSTGATLGTPTNPVFTDSVGQSDAGQSRQVVEVHFHGSGFLVNEDLKRVLQQQFDADEVIIHRSSRQAAEIRSTS